MVTYDKPKLENPQISCCATPIVTPTLRKGFIQVDASMGGCRQEEVIMKFEAVHDIDRQRSEIMEQCINILNYEWPRSEAIRWAAFSCFFLTTTNVFRFSVIPRI